MSLQIGPWSIDRRRRLASLQRVARAQTERGLTTVDWVEKFAPKDRTGQFSMPKINPDDIEFLDDTDGSARPE